MSEARRDDLARNYLLNVGDGVTFAIGMAFASGTAILPLFVSQFDVPRWVIGLIPALFMLGIQAPQVLGAAYRARLATFWGPFRRHIFWPRLALIAMAVTPLLPGDIALFGFFATFAAFALALGFQAPSWMEYIGYMIPADRRGVFFGVRLTLGGLCSLAASWLAAALLDRLPGQLGYAACFGLAAMFVLAGFLMEISVRFDWNEVDRRRRDTAPFWSSAIYMVRESREFQAYLGARVLMTGGTMALAFYVVDAMDRFGLTVAQSSLLAIALVHLPSLSGTVWGWAADRYGNKRTMTVLAAVAALSSVILVQAPSLPLYTVGLFGVGCGTVVLQMLDPKWLMQIDQARMGAVVSVFGLAMAPWSILLPVAAGIIATRAGMPALFWLTAAFWALGGGALALFAREPGQGPETTSRSAP